VRKYLGKTLVVESVVLDEFADDVVEIGFSEVVAAQWISVRRSYAAPAVVGIDRLSLQIESVTPMEVCLPSFVTGYDSSTEQRGRPPSLWHTRIAMPAYLYLLETSLFVKLGLAAQDALVGDWTLSLIRQAPLAQVYLVASILL